MNMVNPCLVNIPILYPLKTPENQSFLVLSGVKNGIFYSHIVAESYRFRSIHFRFFNPLNASVVLIETSQLICITDQLTGFFYMRATLAFNGLKLISQNSIINFFDF